MSRSHDRANLNVRCSMEDFFLDKKEFALSFKIN